jgi:polyisoprenoid-binding protein YceI
MRSTIFPALLALVVIPSASLAEAPVFAVVPSGSSITVKVSAPKRIQGRFNKWKSTLAFTSPDVSTGGLVIKVDAASLDTGSLIKNNVIKGSKYLNVKQYPYITFQSSKISQTGPNNFTVDGTFTFRGATKPQTMLLSTIGRGTSSGAIKGTMTLSDKVEVAVDLRVNHVSGPPVATKM